MNSAAIPRDVLIAAFDIEPACCVQHFADRVGEVQRELRDDIERDVYDIIASDVDWCDDEQIYIPRRRHRANALRERANEQRIAKEREAWRNAMKGISRRKR